MSYGKYAKDDPVSYAAGVFPALELLSARPNAARVLLYHPSGAANDGLCRLLAKCEELRVPIEAAPRAIERISGKKNCYAIVVFEKYSETLNANANHLVLHNISDMGNLGTILRTCLGFGLRDIALIRPAVDHFDPRTVRSSMGAIFSSRICYYESFATYEASIGTRNSYFFRLQNAHPLPEIQRYPRPISLIFGNESSGLPDELCLRETGVLIPQTQTIDSLNLAVAVGIGLYEMVREVV